ncbi:MAG: hypothetical protein ABIB43_05975 [archaeon]
MYFLHTLIEMIIWSLIFLLLGIIALHKYNVHYENFNRQIYLLRTLGILCFAFIMMIWIIFLFNPSF